MSKRCAICDKGTVIGRSISHAHNVTARSMRANLQRVRAWFGGTSQRIWVCTRCLRSGRVTKPPVRQWQRGSSEPQRP